MEEWSNTERIQWENPLHANPQPQEKRQKGINQFVHPPLKTRSKEKVALRIIKVKEDPTPHHTKQQRVSRGKNYPHIPLTSPEDLE